MKRYTVIFLFNKNMNKVILMKRNKNPFKNKLNGFGGSIEEGESVVECAIRETKEETGLNINDFKLFVTYIYPENSLQGEKSVELNVLYTSINYEVDIKENIEGTFDWYDVDYVMDYTNTNFAGYANISMFIREILIYENKIKFY